MRYRWLRCGVRQIIVHRQHGMLALDHLRLQYACQAEKIMNG